MTKITYKEAMTRGQIKKAILFAETAKTKMEYPEDGAPIGVYIQETYILLHKIIEILKSICTQLESSK